MFTCDEVEYYYLLLADADWWKIVWGKLGDKNLGWPVNMQYIYDDRWFRCLAGEMDSNKMVKIVKTDILESYNLAVGVETGRC